MGELCICHSYTELSVCTCSFSMKCTGGTCCYRKKIIHAIIPLLTLFPQCNRGRISCPSCHSLPLKGVLPRNPYIISCQNADKHVPPPLRLTLFIKQMLPSLYKLRLESFNGIQSFTLNIS